ncbi:WG repeat-containing protein [Sphingobacterium sp. LRF_L2]|uniref:WG repeat-containing protein n=1 Tax=Sphingobacterium sp. LRF_L2 TaxID=3369421 RepID=UPI003F5EF3CC
MKRFLILCIFCSLLINIYGQNRALYLFVTADSSFQGIKDQNGAIVVPAQYPVIGQWDAGSEIKDSIIDFYGLPQSAKFTFDSIRVGYTYNTTFDREGKVLYHPFFFDNGADYIEEGARRFVDINTGKMGLVHPYGKILIPALYDFLTPLNDGYVEAYQGVKRKMMAGGENWSIAADPDKEYKRTVLSKKGEIVEGTEVPLNENTVRFGEDSLYYPEVYPIVDNFDKQILDTVHNDLDTKYLIERSLNAKAFKIIERPSKVFPYYVIGPIGDFISYYILVDTELNLYFFDYVQRKVPLHIYVEEQRNARVGK